MDAYVFFVLVFCSFSCFMGYLWGGTKQGHLVCYTNELPNVLMTIISTDKISTVLEEVSVEKKRFLVSTEVFGGKPVRPKDVVRKIRTDKERTNFGIPVLGYPPLVKDVI